MGVTTPPSLNPLGAQGDGHWADKFVGICVKRNAVVKRVKPFTKAFAQGSKCFTIVVVFFICVVVSAFSFQAKNKCVTNVSFKGTF